MLRIQRLMEAIISNSHLILLTASKREAVCVQIGPIQHSALPNYNVKIVKEFKRFEFVNNFHSISFQRERSMQ